MNVAHNMFESREANKKILIYVSYRHIATRSQRLAVPDSEITGEKENLSLDR